MGARRFSGWACTAVLGVGMAAQPLPFANPSTAAEPAGRDPLPSLDGTGGNVFISGHSLTAAPFPDYLAAMAAEAGKPIRWNMQGMGGSSMRSRYQPPEAMPQNGMPSLDRNGRLIDARQELVRPTIPGGGYDVLIITEQHRLLDSLVWQDTVHALRAFQDAYMEGSPRGTTYFYTPWIGLSDRQDPVAWIDYETAALPVWQCVVDRVNQDIAASGRSDRIRLLPASLSLAYLVERLWRDDAPAGFDAMEPGARLQALFTDDVHLTALGAFYTAAVSYLWIYGGSADAMPLPAQADAAQGAAIRSLAAEFVASAAAGAPAQDATACRSPVPLSFIARYVSYTERTYHRAELGIVSSKLRQVREFIRFALRFRKGLG